jgi:phosphodiesterase/alkaline phosphatase D-like protein
MFSFSRLLFVGTAITGIFAQYNDGYETVNLPTDPVQIRLAYHGPTSMIGNWSRSHCKEVKLNCSSTVSWNTFEQLPNPSVSYGTDPSNLGLTASSSVSITYNTSLTWNNHVTLTGLSPYTVYYYQPQYSNATTPYTFTTARAAGDSTPYTVGVVIDMGTFGALGLSSSIPAADNPLGPTEQTTIAALKEAINEYEFVVHPGDLAYADAWAKEEAAGEIPSGPALAQYTVVYGMFQSIILLSVL